jgi:hypothetical protein
MSKGRRERRELERARAKEPERKARHSANLENEAAVHSNRPAWLNWAILRLAGILAFISLGIALVMGTQFWPGVGLLYFGLIILPIDLWYEDFFRKRPKKVRAVIGVIYLLAVIVSSAFIFRSAPFEITASSSLQQYGPGSVINGIHWDAGQSDLHFSIKNPTTLDYDGFDAEVSTDLTITALRQLRGLSICNIEDPGPQPDFHVQRQIGGQPVGPADSQPEKYKIIPLDRNGIPILPKFYRIICEKVPSNSVVDFLGTLGNATGAPRAANWISVTAQFQTSGRYRKETISECRMGASCRTDSTKNN